MITHKAADLRNWRSIVSVWGTVCLPPSWQRWITNGQDTWVGWGGCPDITRNKADANGGTCQLWPTRSDPGPWRWPWALAGWTGTAHREAVPLPGSAQRINQPSCQRLTWADSQAMERRSRRDYHQSWEPPEQKNTQYLQFSGWKSHLDVIVVKMYLY